MAMGRNLARATTDDGDGESELEDERVQPAPCHCNCCSLLPPLSSPLHP